MNWIPTLSIIGFLAIYGEVAILCRAQKVRLLNSIRARIQDMAFRYANDAAVTSAETRANIAGTVLNEIEFLALLTERGDVPQRMVDDHLGGAIVRWHDSFVPYVTSEDKDGEPYSCLRRMVERLRKREARAKASHAARRGEEARRGVQDVP